MTMIEGTIWSLPDEQFKKLRRHIDRRYIRRYNVTAQRVAQLFDEGKTPHEIAAITGLAPRTIRRYRPKPQK